MPPTKRQSVQFPLKPSSSLYPHDLKIVDHQPLAGIDYPFLAAVIFGEDDFALLNADLPRSVGIGRHVERGAPDPDRARRDIDSPLVRPVCDLPGDEAEDAFRDTRQEPIFVRVGIVDELVDDHVAVRPHREDGVVEEHNLQRSSWTDDHPRADRQRRPWRCSMPGSVWIDEGYVAA